MIEYTEYATQTTPQNVLKITVCTDQVGLIAAIQRAVRRHKRYQERIERECLRRKGK